MQSAAPPENEAGRLQALKALRILDTEDEQAFDELTELAAAICGSPISLISLLDEQRQWFKSRVGLDARETSRNLAFCSHAILREQVLQVPDTLEDLRFHDNPLVTGDPHIRFYAGAPLTTAEGHRIGTLCVIDRKPRTLSPEQMRALEILAKQVMSQMELRVQKQNLTRLNKRREQLFAVLAHDLRSPFNSILGLAKRMSRGVEKMSGEKVVQASQSILNASMQVYQTLDELLQWSQYLLGSLQHRPQRYTLMQLVTESAELFSEAMALKNLKLQQDFDRQLTVYTDKTIAKTAIRNLLHNAIKFSPERGTITLAAARAAQANKVHVLISDQGPGVDQTQHDSLFQTPAPGGQAPTGEAGFGLGLMLCREFLRQQGNDIWLEASSAQGSSFAFDLHLPPAA